MIADYQIEKSLLTLFNLHDFSKAMHFNVHAIDNDIVRKKLSKHCCDF